LIFRVEGEGGRGGSVVGEILARSAARQGFHIQCSRAFPAEIKGGRAWFQFKVSSNDQTWWGGEPHLTLADGKGSEWVISLTRKDGDPLRAPLSPAVIAKSLGEARSSNMVALGFLAEALGLDEPLVEAVAQKRLSRRGEPNPHISESIAAGYKAGRDAGWFHWTVKAPEVKGRRLVLNGNEAIALGALAAGVRFFCGYPITPASSILEMMLKELPDLGGVAIQMEDEMAALAACLGASYAGKRAMCATSGPGFALMSELLNLAVVSEVPITVVDVQRSGPATGQPSKSEQGDLLYALHGSPGDSPRLVLAPSTVEEAFYLTHRAVNLAEEFQMPVIVLSDAALSNRIEAIPEPDWESLPRSNRARVQAGNDDDYAAAFERYLLTPTGVSPTSLPGRDDLPFVAAGMEHSSTGSPAGDAAAHQAMSAKRLRKVGSARAILAAEPPYNGLGKGARVGVVGWGSTAGAIEEARRILKRQGVRLATAQIRHLNPLPVEQLREWMRSLERIIVAEENQSGQLASLIRHLAPERMASLLPQNEFEITPEQVIMAVKEEMARLLAA